MKFCQYIATLYLHILSNFGRFILICNKMALIFLGVPIDINVSSFQFHQVKKLAMMYRSPHTVNTKYMVNGMSNALTGIQCHS